MCYDPQKSHKCICVQVDCLTTWNGYVVIQVEGRNFCQSMPYINMPNTCFLCLNTAHKIILPIASDDGWILVVKNHNQANKTIKNYEKANKTV